MFIYSRSRQDVFHLHRLPQPFLMPNVTINTQIKQLCELSSNDWQSVRTLQSRGAILYLKLKYGSADTYILLSHSNNTPVHVQWLVPARKMKRRYPFLPPDAYAIISVVTAPNFRGNNIYPSQIQIVASSFLPTNDFWIWAASDNLPSIKGIIKAGAIKVAELIQTKWLFGIFSRILYLPTNKA